MLKFMSRLAKFVKKKCKATLLVNDMDMCKLIMYDQQVEEDKPKDREEFQNKTAKSAGNEY